MNSVLPYLPRPLLNVKGWKVAVIPVAVKALSIFTTGLRRAWVTSILRYAIGEILRHAC